MDDENRTFEVELMDTKQKKSPIFLNGYGVGKIIEMGKDYLKFEVIEEKEDTTKKKVEGKMKDIKDKYLTKEVMTFQISKIEIISTGAKRLEKTEKEEKLDDDLGAI